MKELRNIGGLLAVLVLSASGHAAAIDRVYVFGDSYSDSGAGYVDGNGPTAVVYLAERLGLKLVPAGTENSAGQSLNFAVSGAGTGRGAGRKVKDATLGVGMRNQVDDFARRAPAFRPESTLFFIAGGLNDRRLTSAVTVANLKELIRILYRAGGRRFMVALLPTAIPAFADVSKRLNPELARIPDALKAELPGASLTISQWGPFFDQVMNAPEKYGIKNTTAACAGRAVFDEDAKPCAEPSAHFYYHSGHPSTAVHKAVGEKLHAEVTALSER